MPAAQQTWRAASAARLSVYTLDALTAVYDRVSGQTHLLAQPLPEILAALQSGPANTAETAERLTADFDIADSADVPARITECLGELAALGLVSQA
ncbi:MAG: HPr-rel-A system PqqD family peptide chaperone [Sphingopyxis sp.]